MPRVCRALAIAVLLSGAGLAGRGARGEDAVVRRHEEISVVSASKSEEALLDAPATMSVVSAEEIAAAPSTNVGDLLRSVPGTNVIQMSARDVDLATRQATSTLPNSMLALIDGRSIYLDFFGIILWDFVPTDPAEIKQIEVVRGPASAIWGANAMVGVVNILTQAPRDSAGTSLRVWGGLFDRDAGSGVGQGAGGQYGVSVRHARVLSDSWAMKVSAGYSASDAFARPVGMVPLDVNPLIPGRVTGGGTFASYVNQGSRQPKLDVRFDEELGGGQMTYAAGYAGTTGIIHSGIGPFDIQPGSYMAYGRASYSRGHLKLAGFLNYVDAHAPNLQATDAVTGLPVHLDFKQSTLDFEVGNATVIGKHHLLTYGGNVRHNAFDITIAPGARARNEAGAYLQEEAFVGPLRVALGGRLDKFGNLEGLAFSPRAMVMWRPAAAHSLRLSFNEAFRAPAALNNYLDLTIRGVDFPLGAVCALSPPLCAQDPTLATRVLGLGPRSVGSEVARTISATVPPLSKESVKAYELAYTGRLDSRTTASAAFNVSDSDDNINFVSDPEALHAVGLPVLYSASYPPPGWPFPPALVDSPALRATVFDHVPGTIAYLNLGPVRNQGVEVSLERKLWEGARASLDYSWQADPKPLAAAPGQIAFPKGELAVPAHHRTGASLSVDRNHVFGTLSAHYVGRTYWNDVLAQLGFDGYTGPYTLVDACVGMRWAKGRVQTVLKGTNLLNREIRQHIFGDIQRIGIGAELRVSQ
jgi:outer membrane receptor protein involved in Fe transport